VPIRRPAGKLVGMNHQAIKLAFGLVVRILGFWTALQGIQTIFAGFVTTDNGRAFLLGLFVTLIGLGVLRYAVKIVRFTYPHADQDIE
jgi:hydrogenase-4 membrane subunit HyfE